MWSGRQACSKAMCHPKKHLACLEFNSHSFALGFEDWLFFNSTSTTDWMFLRNGRNSVQTIFAEYVSSGTNVVWRTRLQQSLVPRLHYGEGIHYKLILFHLHLVSSQ
jgi:hypothetical protein